MHISLYIKVNALVCKVVNKCISCKWSVKWPGKCIWSDKLNCVYIFWNNLYAFYECVSVCLSML